MKILAFNGPPGSGKSTFCNYLAREYGYHHLNFADALKEATVAAWDLSPEQTNGPLKGEIDPRWGVTPRTILQHLGTEHGRALCSYLWEARLCEQIGKRCGISDRFWRTLRAEQASYLDWWKSAILAHRKETTKFAAHRKEMTKFCIGDLRFPSEYALLKDLGAKFVKLAPFDAQEHYKVPLTHRLQGALRSLGKRISAKEHHGGIPGHSSEAGLDACQFDVFFRTRKSFAEEISSLKFALGGF